MIIQKLPSLHRGFTLIELVIVVVLLAILASVALPRFLDITSSAHDANVSGTTGALGSALSIAHAKWLASGQPTTSSDNVAGLDLTKSGHADTGFSMLGWPNAATSGANDLSANDILEQGGDDPGICAAIAQNLLSSSSMSFGAGKGCGKEYCTLYEKPNCIYVYQQDMSKERKIIYNVLTGQVKKEIP